MKSLKSTLILCMAVVIGLSACKEDDQINPNDPCGGATTFSDPRDGQTYNIVPIGSQCWFAENLNYETGDSWCYDNNTANCNTYGRLYYWQTSLNACPSGWHLPTEAEWTELIDYLGGETEAAEKIKSTTGWSAPNTEATNSSGFSALPGGERFFNGIFNGLGSYGIWWSSKEKDEVIKWSLVMSYNDDFEGRVSTQATNPMVTGFSCRCLRD